jgi:hypothetical protein
VTWAAPFPLLAGAFLAEPFLLPFCPAAFCPELPSPSLFSSSSPTSSLSSITTLSSSSPPRASSTEVAVGEDDDGDGDDDDDEDDDDDDDEDDDDDDDDDDDEVDANSSLLSNTMDPSSTPKSCWCNWYRLSANTMDSTRSLGTNSVSRGHIDNTLRNRKGCQYNVMISAQYPSLKKQKHKLTRMTLITFFLLRKKKNKKQHE